MKKLLSVLMASLMLAGLVAVAASAEFEALDFDAVIAEEAIAEDDAVLEAQGAFPTWEALQIALQPAVNAIEARLDALPTEKRLEIKKAFKNNNPNYESTLAKGYAPLLGEDIAVAAMKEARTAYFDYYSFQLTVFVPFTAWKAVDANFFAQVWQFIKFIVSGVLRYIFFGWTGWMY